MSPEQQERAVTLLHEIDDKTFGHHAVAIMEVISLVREEPVPDPKHYIKTDIDWAGSGRDGDPWRAVSWNVEECDCTTPWRHEALA